MPESIDLSRYEKAPIMEEYHRDDIPSSSSSDRGDDTTPMLGSEKIALWPPKPIKWIRSPWMFFLDLCLIALVMISYSISAKGALPGPQGDVTGFVPEFSQQVTVFKSHPEFISNHTSLSSLEEAREAWMSYLPRGQGYIRVNEAEIRKFDLPKPVEYKGTRSLGTSWMHGLHCLYLIMSEYDMLAMGMRQPGYDTWHFDHCLDYVRQLIVCSGDMALAGGDLPDGSTFLNVPHVCKAYDEMYEYLEGRRDNDAYQFGSHETHWVPP